MLNGLKRRLFHRLIHKVFKGIDPKQVPDLTQMSANELDQYCRSARNLLRNEAYKGELQYLRYKQERQIAERAETAEDLIFGKAVLWTLDYIDKRFEELSNKIESGTLQGEEY